MTFLLPGYFNLDDDSPFLQIVNVTQAPSPSSTGRRLRQANSDNITNGVQNDVNANITVDTQNVSVSLTVLVPFQDSNNASAVVQSAINSGQVRRGLQEAGEQASAQCLMKLSHTSCGHMQICTKSSTWYITVSNSLRIKLLALSGYLHVLMLSCNQ